MEKLEESTKQANITSNKAVEILVSGRTEDALETFRSALSLIEAAAEAEKAQAAIDIRPLHDYQVNDEEESSCQRDATSQFSSIEIEELKDSYMHIYNRAVIFYEDAASDVGSCVRITAEATAFRRAAILFNIALAFHRQAQNCRDSHAELRAALNFYDLCLRSLSTMPSHQYSTSIMWLLLAVWNNQAVILFALRDFSSASLWFEGVRRLSVSWMLVPPNALTKNEIEHLCEYILNVVVYQEPIAAASA